MLKHCKTYQLHDKQSSYLLLISHEYIVTNNNYIEWIVLNHKLEFVKHVHLPKKEFICHYAYRKKGGECFLMDDDEGEALILLDTNTFDAKLLENEQLKTINASTSYIWINDTFTALAHFRKTQKPVILSVNTQNEKIDLNSFDDRYLQAPQLAHYLENEKTNKAWPICCNQAYMILGDFSETSIVSIIDLNGTIVRTTSIKKEIEIEIIRSEGRLRAERFPHDIDYQNGWILLIWEKKVVVVSPANKHTEIPMEHLEYSPRAKFIATDNSFAKFVILVQNYGKDKGAELRLYGITV